MWLRSVIQTLCVSATLAQSAKAETFYFCWSGDGGYTLTGRMVVDDSQLAKPVITQTDVTTFQITGYLDGNAVGSWNMADRTADTTWHLRFVPATLTFPTGGSFGTNTSQGWNADGTTRNCGTPGFGFNSGNAGQDVCINSTYIAASRIPPATPLVASLIPVTPDCRGIVPFS